MQSPPTVRPLTSADFLSHNRGGGLYSESVSQRVGSSIALASHRLHLSPSALSILGATIGVVASAAVAALAPAYSGRTSWLYIGLAGGIGWQLAYAFDCADGQLARTTGNTSPAGARLDILCDVAVQVSVVAAIAAVAAQQAVAPPAWLSALFAATWMVNVVTSVLASGVAHASLIKTASAPIRVLKLARDYGAVIATCSLVIAIAPKWTTALIGALSMLNGVFLLVSLGQAAKGSLTTPGPSKG